MLIVNRTVRFVVAGLLVLLLVPLITMLGMMLAGGGMMAQMGGMPVSGAVMALCGLWTVLVAAALVFLLVMVSRTPAK